MLQLLGFFLYSLPEFPSAHTEKYFYVYVKNCIKTVKSEKLLNIGKIN